MKKSISYWTLGGFDGAVPVVDAAKTAKQLGFDAIELCYGAGELVPSASESALQGLRSALDKVGLPLSSMASGAYWAKSLSSPDDTERREAIEFTRAYIHAAAVLGAEAILVLPGTVDVPWDPARPVVAAKQARELATESLRGLIPAAEREGVTICVENVWNKFLTGPFEFAEFIDSFASARLKAYFDAGNVLILGYPEHWVEILGARIERVHVKNFKRRDGGGTLNDFTASLMDGDLNWRDVFAALKSAGYNGYITAEMLVTEKGLPDLELAQRTCREMRSLIEQYG